ncbi:MAG: hypothetical protein R3E96_13310 [Planctomycetota bacterium]
MAFALPGDGHGKVVRGTGAVVRCERISARLEHFEIAVFLTDMAEPDRAAIAAYVDRWKQDHTA